MKLKEYASKIVKNQKIISDAKSENYGFINMMIKEHGKVMAEDTFWALCKRINDGIKGDDNNINKYEDAIHSLFTHSYNTGVNDMNIEYPDFLDFVHTYNKVVSKVANDASIWKHGGQFEYFSDDGWCDFTDFLPIMGKEVYEHVLAKGEETMADGTKPWTREHEAYIETTLSRKIGVWANEALTEEEEDELWV